MSDNDFSLALMLRAQDLAYKASLSFHTGSQLYTNQMFSYLEDLQKVVSEYDASRKESV